MVILVSDIVSKLEAVGYYLSGKGSSELVPAVQKCVWTTLSGQNNIYIFFFIAIGNELAGRFRVKVT